MFILVSTNLFIIIYSRSLEKCLRSSQTFTGTYYNFFSIVSIKSSDELSNQSQYLYWQLYSLCKIRCLIFSLFETNTSAVKEYEKFLLKEIWRVLKNKDMFLILLNVNSLSQIVDYREEIAKNVKRSSNWHYWIRTK